MKRQSHSIEVIFVFLLFAVFAILSMLLIFIGSDNYNSILHAQDRNMDTRTAISYISNKIRANDRKDAVEIREINGIDVLALKYEKNGEQFENLIYCYENAIREALTYPGLEFDLSYGEKLLEADSLMITYQPEQKIVSFTVTGLDGSKKNMIISLKSGD